MRKAASRAERVTLFAYGSGQTVWWRRHADDLARTERLAVAALAPETTRELATLADRTMSINVTIQEGGAWVDDGRTSLSVGWDWLQSPDAH